MSDPTPEEIKQKCAEIQAGWSEQEKAKRAGTTLNPEFVIPKVMDPDLQNYREN